MNLSIQDCRASVSGLQRNIQCFHQSSIRVYADGCYPSSFLFCTTQPIFTPPTSLGPHPHRPSRAQNAAQHQKRTQDQSVLTHPCFRRVDRTLAVPTGRRTARAFPEITACRLTIGTRGLASHGDTTDRTRIDGLVVVRRLCRTRYRRSVGQRGRAFEDMRRKQFITYRLTP